MLELELKVELLESDSAGGKEFIRYQIIVILHQNFTSFIYFTQSCYFSLTYINIISFSLPMFAFISCN